MKMTIARRSPAPLQATHRAEVRVEKTSNSIVNIDPSIPLEGSARLYREPVSKTNRPIILNAVEYVVLPGEVCSNAIIIN